MLAKLTARLQRKESAPPLVIGLRSGARQFIGSAVVPVDIGDGFCAGRPRAENVLVAGGPGAGDVEAVAAGKQDDGSLLF